MINERRRGRFTGLLVLAAGLLVLFVGAAVGPRIISAICFGLLGLTCAVANGDLAPAFYPSGEPSSDRLGRLAAVLLGAFLVAGGIVRLG
jgi:hypothetical protein